MKIALKILTKWINTTGSLLHGLSCLINELLIKLRIRINNYIKPVCVKYTTVVTQWVWQFYYKFIAHEVIMENKHSHWISWEFTV